MPTLDLGSRPWFLAPTSRIGINAPLDDPVRLDDWIPATVPGSIQRDLMQAGRLPDLYRELDLDVMLRRVDEQDWWYRTTVPGIDADQRAWLQFSGIDYQAAVTLGGRELGRGSGMYATREWEVTEQLRLGSAELAVRIWGGGALPLWPNSVRLRFQRWLMTKVQGGIGAFDDRLLTWKAPVHSGWDFAPRLLAAGIWDDVTLHTARSVGIIDTWVRADWGAKRGIFVKITLDSDRDQTVELHANLSSTNHSKSDLSHKKYLKLRKGLQTIHLSWETAHLKLWNTHDRGFPHLYRLRLQLTDKKGLLDEHETTVGARTIGWGSNGGRNLADVLYLNGEPLYLRGVNWVPVDLLRGDKMEEDRYRYLLQAAVDAGVNAIRVWGGGGRERKIFYDLCDELGLLVWQELPIACVFLDHLPEDDRYLELARCETEGIVRQLRGHPSLALWGGGNEWGPGRHKRLVQALGQVVSQQDPNRRWLLASPGPADSHNWEVWHDRASPEMYADDPAPLLSEFGLAAPPDAETLAAMLPPDQLWPPGPAWTMRKAELDKLLHYARPLLPEPQADISLDQFVAASQEAQARGLQVGIEAYRLRPDAVGTFTWQWNEPWPAICWSIIPYIGSPKRAYAQIARSYAPIAPLARIMRDRIELWVVNDLLNSPGICQLTATLDGQNIWEGGVTPVGNGRIMVGEINRCDALAKCVAPRVLALHLVGPNLDAHNDYDLTWQPTSARRFPPYAWLRRWVKRWVLRW